MRITYLSNFLWKPLLICVGLVWGGPLSGQVDLDEGLVLFYPFDGGGLGDYSGNNYNGVAVGTLPFLSDSSLILLNSFGETYVEIPHESLNELLDFTVSVQVNYKTLHYEGTSENGQNAIVSGGANSSAYANDLLITYRIWDQSFVIVVDNVNYYFTDIILAENTWYCLSVVRNNGLLSVYLDGVKLDDEYLIPNNPLNLSPGGLLIGQEQDCVAGCFDSAQTLDGEIDNLRFYSRALSEEEQEAYCICPEVPVGEICQLTGIFTPGELPNDIKVYPNPVNQNLHIQTIDSQINGIQLLNQLGQVLLNKTKINTGDTIEIPVSNIANGSYYLFIVTEVGRFVYPLVIFHE
ncbi:MAG: T9SS type A sorting domain-containing protein [Saprospiraceae bacterium]|nr:T9SS type A sorting domain-containing protein [Saprospiraceae bacterium]